VSVDLAVCTGCGHRPVAVRLDHRVDEQRRMAHSSVVVSRGHPGSMTLVKMGLSHPEQTVLVAAEFPANCPILLSPLGPAPRLEV